MDFVDQVAVAIEGKGMMLRGIAFRVEYAGGTALVEMSATELGFNDEAGTQDALIEARVNGAFITARNNATRTA